jgi:hypothetical protein
MKTTKLRVVVQAYNPSARQPEAGRWSSRPARVCKQDPLSKNKLKKE